MKKKELLTTVLASLIAINTLGGCANKSTVTDSFKSEIAEEIKDELEPQVDIIELPLEETDESFRNNFGAIKERNFSNLIKCNAKVTTVDISDDPIYRRAYVIANESSYSDKSIKEIYTFLKYINNTDSVEDEFNNMTDYALDDYEFVGDVAYKVEIEYVFQYPATKEELEDGTTVYSAPYGGTLSGTQVIIKKSTLLNGDATMSFLEEYGYIKNDNLKLKNVL